MLTTVEMVREWARAMKMTPALTGELTHTMISVPEQPRTQILNAVLSKKDSTIKLCAESIVSCCIAHYSDGAVHLFNGTDSLLALVPELSPTYRNFAVRNPEDKFLASEAFRKTLDLLWHVHDVPSDFLYDPVHEQGLVDDLHGLMMVFLTGADLEDADPAWLGVNRKSLAPYATVMYERSTVDRTFLETLIHQNTPAISAGIL